MTAYSEEPITVTGTASAIYNVSGDLLKDCAHSSSLQMSLGRQALGFYIAEDHSSAETFVLFLRVAASR